MGSQPVEFDEFAACLRALKGRADLSYGALARETGIGRSSLHRYCSGSYVPQDYGPAHRFAMACGASPEELRRLHRLWSLADAARETGRDAETDPAPDPAVDQDVPHEPDKDPDPTPTPPPPWHRRKTPALVVIALVLALGATAWGIATVSPPGSDADDENRPLLSTACPKQVGLGQRGTCVREVQRLLTRTGAELDVDADFGPQTQRRVTAFQALSRIDADGVVGEETKKALYAPKIRMDTWRPAKVRQRVREVFREAPDRAVAVVECQSSLDPLHIVRNADGTRNWGLFQISDARLRTLGGTPRDAMDPEWNIRAAHRLWSEAKGFGDWARCERTAGPALVPAGDGPPTAPAPEDAPANAACPAPGQRFKTPTDDRVYLVGPGSRLYYVPDAIVYFNLWDDWNAVAIAPGGVFEDCAWDEAYELAGAFLARTSGSSRAYIWDAWYGYRPIPNRTVLDTYGFSEAKIRTRPSLSPVSGDADWQ